MKTAAGREKKTVITPDSGSPAGPLQVLFAESPPGTTFGVVSDSEPSSLALLAAGIAGMATRRARRNERLKSLESQEKET